MAAREAPTRRGSAGPCLGPADESSSARLSRALRGTAVEAPTKQMGLIMALADPGVLEAQLEGRQRHRALHVRLHPVALDLVAEDEERAFLLEPTDQVGVHLF